MIAPRLQAHDGDACISISENARDRRQHGPLGLHIRHAKLQRQGTLVVLPEGDVDMREWLWIAERVLQSRNNPDNSHGLPDSWFFVFDELNQPPESALSRPQTLRK